MVRGLQRIDNNPYTGVRQYIGPGNQLLQEQPVAVTRGLFGRKTTYALVPVVMPKITLPERAPLSRTEAATQQVTAGGARECDLPHFSAPLVERWFFSPNPSEKAAAIEAAQAKVKGVVKQIGIVLKEHYADVEKIQHALSMRLGTATSRIGDFRPLAEEIQRRIFSFAEISSLHYGPDERRIVAFQRKFERYPEVIEGPVPMTPYQVTQTVDAIVRQAIQDFGMAS